MDAPRCRFRPWRGHGVHGSKHDHSALVSVGAGSEAAFLALVDRYHAGLLRVACLWLDDPSEAEEVVRETWLEMLHRLDRFDEQVSLKGWLCAVLIGLARARAGDEQAIETASSQADADGPAVDPARFRPPGDRWEGHWQKPPSDWPGMRPGQVLPAELRGELETALRALPSPQRIVLVLRDLEGLSSREVSNALGVGDDDQKALLHRARSRIRAALERHYDQTPGAV
jgi:RNA polymerase sigma-70 factor (ECF subfamily)